MERFWVKPSPDELFLLDSSVALLPQNDERKEKYRVILSKAKNPELL